jgi:adhesin transport system membrane fusion protein
MRDHQVMDLADCTEFRQTIMLRPPAFVHGTALLLVLLLAAALIWAALTQADLVVLAGGHVRPVNPPRQVFVDYHGETTTAGLGVAVAEVKYRQGDEVQAGDVLIRMDTKRLDSERQKKDMAIQAGEKALVRLKEQLEVLAQQSEKARAEAQTELAQVEKEVRTAKEKRAVEIQTAQDVLTHALNKLARERSLYDRKATSLADLEDARLQVRQAEGELKKAELPVVEEKVEVSRQKLARLEKDFLLKHMDLLKEQAAKKRDVDLARMERDRLDMERRQAVVRAPIAGIVISREVKVGDVLEPGKSAIEIAEQQGFRFEAAISTGDVAHLRLDMPARIKLDAYDYQKYGTVSGKVCFISPDAKVVEGQRLATYLVKIELATDTVGRGELQGRIKLGMAGQTEIVTQRESLLVLLLKRLRQTISLG